MFGIQPDNYPSTNIAGNRYDNVLDGTIYIFDSDSPLHQGMLFKIKVNLMITTYSSPLEKYPQTFSSLAALVTLALRNKYAY